MYKMFLQSIKQHNFSTLIIIRKISWAANQHISEVSCDTEDWSNDAENTALHHRKNGILKYINENSYFKILIIFHNVTVLLYFD